MKRINTTRRFTSPSEKQSASSLAFCSSAGEAKLRSGFTPTSEGQSAHICAVSPNAGGSKQQGSFTSTSETRIANEFAVLANAVEARPQRGFTPTNEKQCASLLAFCSSAGGAKPQSGFTLIELLLYMSLCIIMASIVGGVGVNVLGSRSKAYALDEVRYSAQFSLGALERAVRNAESITSPSAGATSSSLVLEMNDATKNPTIFDISDGHLRITEGNSVSVNLTSGSTEVNELEFRNRTRGDAEGTVTIRLSIDAYTTSDNSSYRAPHEFFTTVTLRR